MSRRILVISTSLRRNSNSEALANAFARGAQEAGAEVEQVTLREKQIGFCRGCLACQRTGSCVQKDDAQEIVANMNYADTIVFATPIYYY